MSKKKSKPPVQLELPGFKNSKPAPKTMLQECFDLIETVKKRASARVLNRLEEIELHANGYAEPGYKNPESGIIALGNWNSVKTWDAKGQETTAEDNTPCELGDMLVEKGVELEWSDEWTACEDCGKLCRRTGDSYHWKRCYWEDEDSCGVTCVHCIKANKIMAQSYLESLENDSSKAVTLDLDLEKYGYKKVNGDFENGWHDGQNDDPHAIKKALNNLGITRFVFNIDGVGQFDIGFSAWVHKSQVKKFNQEKFQEQPLKQYPTPAENLSKALQSAPITAGRGITVTECHGDGTSSSRVITPQEFVEGKAFAEKGA